MTQVFTGPPNITAHPISHMITAGMNVTLNCEGTGRGSIKYLWETNDVNEGQWARISNSHESSLVVTGLEQSQQYRCAVSNEVGTVTSNIAVVMVLSEYVKTITTLFVKQLH